MNDNGKKRVFPAEWERHDCVMMAWPHENTDWNYMLPEVRACFAEIIRTICEEERVLLIVPEGTDAERLAADYSLDTAKITMLGIPANDTWARDFGPITIEIDGKPVMLDFKFNGWGLKFAADKDNLINSRAAAAGAFAAPLVNRLNFVLEGGSVESDGEGTLLTTSKCLLSPNRNGQLSRADIEDFLIATFGLRQVIWIDNGALAGDDTDSHIDTLCRFAPGETILYTGCDDPADEHYGCLAKMRTDLMNARTPDGKPYNLIELPLPDAVYDEEGNRLPATYANFLITPRSVIMPVYNQPRKDLLATQIMKIAFPDREIKTVDCRPLIKQHGSLHCVTMQMPAGTVSFK